MVLLGLVLAFQNGLVNDARLKSVVDFDLQLNQITDFSAGASKLSGVEFSVAKNVQDLKVDVFVDKRPLGETLDKVAKALNCEWVPVAQGYQLQMDVKNVNRERNFNQAEDEEELRFLKLMLWGRQYVSGFFPATNQKRRMGESFFTVEERNKITGPYEKEYRDAEKANDPTRMRAGFEKWSAVENALGDYMIGRIMSQFDKAATERFWKGEPFLASTYPGAQYKIYPSDFQLGIRSSYATTDGKTMEADYEHFSFFRFDPIANRMRMNMLTYAIMPAPYASNGASKGGGGFAYSSTSNPVSEALKSQAFYVDLKPWMDQDATPAKFSQMLDKQTKEWKSPWLNMRRRLGDHLRWFHQATNIPVVAQADRSCTWSWINMNRGFDTATQYLSAMMKDNEMLAQEDGGFLVARNFRYWRHRRHEAPEAIWARYEQRKENSQMSFQEYVSLAQSFREDQLYSQEIGYPMSKVNASSVISSYDSLRLFGMLSMDQQKSALDKGISIADLDSAQQKQIVDTLVKLILDTGIPSLELSKSLITKGMTADRFGALQFKVKLTELPEQDNYVDELKDGDTVLQKRGTARYASSNFEFNYSVGPGETVGQAIQIRK